MPPTNVKHAQSEAYRMCLLQTLARITLVAVNNKKAAHPYDLKTPQTPNPENLTSSHCPQHRLHSRSYIANKWPLTPKRMPPTNGEHKNQNHTKPHKTKKTRPLTATATTAALYQNVSIIHPKLKKPKKP